MRKSNPLLQLYRSPHRQSWVAILMVVVKTYRVIVGQAWPVLLVFFLGDKERGFSFYILAFIVATAVLGMAYSIVNFFRYYFYIENDELVIESGVFKRSKLNVPFDRIQTINTEQTIIHRIFDVVRLKVDTAGTAKEEFVFQAISNSTANDLKMILLADQSKQRQTPHSLSEQIELESDKERVILSLNPLELLRAGAVENHLKSGGLIIIFIFWIWENIENTPLGKYFMLDENIVRSGMQTIALFTILFLVLSFVISLLRMILTNFDLKFIRTAKGFKVNSGLFTKADTTALDSKIQVVGWSDNLLKKLLKIFDLRLKQASSVQIANKKSISVPACNATKITDVVQTLFPKIQEEHFVKYRIEFDYVKRYGMYLSLFFLPLLGLLLYFSKYEIATVAGLLYLLIVLNIVLQYRKKSVLASNRSLIVKGGSYGDKTELISLHKIQSLKKVQTPYQRRNKLANLVIFTASGSLSVPYLKEAVADSLFDYLTYRIENSKRPWM